MPAGHSPSSVDLEKLSGIVKRVTFHSVETGYTVLKVNSFHKPNENLTVVVHQSKEFAGATMDFFGEWTNHPTYGLQFKASQFQERKLATANALEKYLGSGLIKGVGPVTVKRIVRRTGLWENHDYPGLGGGAAIHEQESAASGAHWPGSSAHE